MYYAHSVEDQPRDTWQPLHEHSRQVAELAAKFAKPFGAHRAASLAGLLHDLGKYTAAFQARLDGGKSVDHATAGAKQVGLIANGPYDKIIAELIAYVIAGHHSGLPDKIGVEKSLTARLKKPIEQPDNIWQQELSICTNNLWPSVFQFEKDRAKAAFQLSFLGRMIFSCLVDADRLDTEAFCAHAEGWQPDRNWPQLGAIIDTLQQAFQAYMKDKQTQAQASPVNLLRREILNHVLGRASDKTGLFTLTVPTGGGKTLASLGFALEHAKVHGLQRIVYAIPFTSVVDQTASVFRDVLGNEVILEHHSAIESGRQNNRDENKEGDKSGRDKLKLAMENWSAPIVVTTNVQLFESLFAAKPSRCRKLHNLAQSLMILDEAQTIPLPYLKPCIAALDELAKNYGSTIVLCTATQPALDAQNFENGLKLEGRELAPDPRRLANELKRVRIRFGGDMDDDALVDELAAYTQGLVIVNSRGHALSLYRKVTAAGLEGAIHLTTRHYAAHRREILAEVRKRLEDKAPCRVIATSLIEAGVDVDFPRLWRAEAGLDQIAQAAGRCNREGKRAPEDSIVTIFTAPDNAPPREIKQLAGDFARMADKHRADLLSPDAIENYFREVYWHKDKKLDAKDILDSFALSCAETSFAYRTVAENFRFIESGMVPVIIARNEKAKEALAKLQYDGVSPGGIARDLQPYVVQVPPAARVELLAARHVTFENEKDFADQFAVLRTPSLYDEDKGLLWENAAYLEIEKTLF